MFREYSGYCNKSFASSSRTKISKSSATVNINCLSSFNRFACSGHTQARKTNECLSFVVLSAHSLLKHNAFQLLTAEVLSVKPDRICICETWLKVKHSETMFTIDGYTCHRLDRKGRAGGGVCIYVNNRLQLRRLVLQKTLDFAELIWIRVSCND